MMDIRSIAYLVNIIVLLIVLILGMRLVRNASLYNYAIGDDPRQTELKYKILKLIVAIAVLAFSTAVFNIFIL